MQLPTTDKHIQLIQDTIVPAMTVSLAKPTNRNYRRAWKLASHKPDDYSDIGQADIFAQEYNDVVRWTDGTGFLAYNGQVWLESEKKTRLYLQNLTKKQLKEAEKDRMEAEREVLQAQRTGDASLATEAGMHLLSATAWHKFALSRRDSHKVDAALKESASMLEMDVSELDADPFLLNTPAGTIDLRTGAMKDHNPSDYCTKITGTAPSDIGADVFDSFLDSLTCGETELKYFLQEVVGMCAIGRVFTECLIICYGAGGNGKTTFWNLIKSVLGGYAANSQSDSLTVNGKRQEEHAADLRGLRLAIFPELNTGTVLDIGQVKKISSRDDISGKRLYKDVFTFKPTHTPVLFTNALPAVKSSDMGTWDRLILIPFRGRFRNTDKEKKDYENELFAQCGGAVLSWIIQGAQRYISNGYKLSPPECVSSATDEYRQQNDWFRRFELARCETGVNYRIASSELFEAYRQYCLDSNEIIRDNHQFKEAYTSAGYFPKRTGQGMIVSGLRLAPIPVDIPTPWTEEQGQSGGGD